MYSKFGLLPPISFCLFHTKAEGCAEINYNQFSMRLLRSDIVKSYCTAEPLSVLVLFYVPASWRSVSSIKWNPQQYLALRWQLRGVGSVVSKVRYSINNLQSGLNLETSLSPYKGKNGCFLQQHHPGFNVIFLAVTNKPNHIFLCSCKQYITVRCVSDKFLLIYFCSFTFCDCWLFVGLHNYFAILPKISLKSQF